MIEGEEILSSLNGILEESKRYKDIDAAVDAVANRGKRISLIEGIIVVEAGLNVQWRNLSFTHFVQTTTLVRSHKEPTGRITLTFEGDSELNMKFIFDGRQALAEADSAYERYLYYDEFKQRLQVLKEHILQGKLDGFLVYRPEDVIHKVMGFSGELLKLIGIDPSSGETYRRFLKECEPTEVKPTGDGTFAEVFGKALESELAKKNAQDDVPIGFLPRDNRDSDIALGTPIQPASKNQTGKTTTPKKHRLIKRYPTSQETNNASNNQAGKTTTPKKHRLIKRYPTSQETKTAPKNDSEKPDDEKNRKPQT